MPAAVEAGRGRVSVCIPSYNASRTIGETIRSVLDSTYADLEIIVSDDASTDDTREVVEGFGDPRVRFFSNERNVGPPGNWNRALAKASGEFVGLLNHDDLYGPFWLAFAVHTLDKHPHIGWVASAFRVVDGEGRTLKFFSRFAETGEVGRADAFIRAATLDGFGPGVLVRREVLEASACYDPDAGPGADMDLCLRLAARYPLYYSAKPHASWRVHSTNLTHTWGQIEQAAEGFRILKKAFEDPTLPEELRAFRAMCYLYYRCKVLCRCEDLQQNSDLATVQQLTQLLRSEDL